jgi:Xaa-Pro aminopeptidase
MKARKNRIEIGGMREAHIRDAVALCDFLAYLEESVSMILLHLFSVLCFYKIQIFIEPSSR